MVSDFRIDKAYTTAARKEMLEFGKLTLDQLQELGDIDHELWEQMKDILQRLPDSHPAYKHVRASVRALDIRIRSNMVIQDGKKLQQRIESRKQPQR